MLIDKNSPVPQYFQFQTWLVDQIEQGIYKPKDKIPTEEKFMQMSGLARSTIRQAIQNLVIQGYLSRKRRLGTFVTVPSNISGRSNIIGILVHDIRSGYAPEFLRGAGDEACKNNLSIILCCTDDLYSRAEFHAKRLIDQGVKGIIFMPTAASDEKNTQLLARFTRQGIPVVTVDRKIPNVEIDSVTTDNFHGAYELTKLLIQLGHVRIAVTLSTSISSEMQRLEGYKQALLDHGMAIDPTLIITNKERFIESHYLQYAKFILSQRDKFTAIVAGSDRIAYVIYKVACEMHIKIPEELSIVGYDDLTFRDSHPLDLTTVHQPIYEMGQVAMRLLLERIEGKVHESRSVVLQSKIVQRHSVLPRNRTSGTIFT
ncbi:GntR family transcriptional regulator [candidate division KSB1 bacterium]|nr:GntR family transcriptional regulator [candidate division KSB1 bacterium]